LANVFKLNYICDQRYYNVMSGKEKDTQPKLDAIKLKKQLAIKQKQLSEQHEIKK
jgi:hypothetical protein